MRCGSVVRALVVATITAANTSAGMLHVEGGRSIPRLEQLSGGDIAVSLKLDRVPALNALERLAKEGGFHLEHSGRADCCVVSVAFEKVPIAEALKKVVSDGDLDCEIVDSNTVRVHLPDIQLPVVLTKVEPIYPKDAMAERKSGYVIVGAVVREDGRVSDVKVVRYVPGWPSFSEAAIKAVSRRTYRPATKDGVPVAVDFSMRVDFNLR